MAIKPKSRCGPTGPRTPIGKKRSSRNATKHGIFAIEDAKYQEAKEDLFQSIRMELRASGTMEMEFCHLFADTLVAQKRVERYFDTEARKAHVEAEAAAIEERVLMKIPSIAVSTPNKGVEDGSPRLRASFAMPLLRMLKSEIEDRGLQPDDDLKALRVIYGDSPTRVGIVLLNICKQAQEESQEVCKAEKTSPHQRQENTKLFIWAIGVELDLMDGIEEVEESIERARTTPRSFALPPDDVMVKCAKYQAANYRNLSRLLANFMGLRNLK